MHSDPNASSAQTDDLVLERYGAGHAWLRPQRTAPLTRLRHFAVRFAAATRPAPRYVLTDKGRRDLALSQLFDDGPTVADVMRASAFKCQCSASGSEGRCPFVASSARALEEHYRDWHGWTVRLCAVCGHPERAS